MDGLTTPAIAAPAMPREVPLLMPAQSLRRFCVSTLEWYCPPSPVRTRFHGTRDGEYRLV